MGDVLVVIAAAIFYLFIAFSFIAICGLLDKREPDQTDDDIEFEQIVQRIKDDEDGSV